MAEATKKEQSTKMPTDELTLRCALVGALALDTCPDFGYPDTFQQYNEILGCPIDVLRGLATVIVQSNSRSLRAKQVAEAVLACTLA